MTISQFLEELREILQRDTAVNVDDVLEDLEEWDSMAIMSCMVWFESRLGITHPYGFFLEQETVRDLIKVGEGKIA